MKKSIIFVSFLFTFINTTYSFQKQKKAIVIGATSGMGRQTAKLLAKDGYQVGLVARRVKLLKSLQKEIPTKTYIKKIDVTKTEKAKKQLKKLIKKMGGVDLVMVSVTGSRNIGLTAKDWYNKKNIVMDVDLKGFWTMASVAVEQFEKQKYGHLVGVSSIDGLRGFGYSPEYSAAKAFISRYLESIRNRFIQKKLPIYTTDIIPGYVEVEHSQYHKNPDSYWVATKEQAAKQIMQAIKAKKKKAYITSRWRIIAWILAIIPDCIFNRVNI